MKVFVFQAKCNKLNWIPFLGNEEKCVFCINVSVTIIIQALSFAILFLKYYIF